MKTKLITPEGFEKLKQELDYLWRTERPEVTKIVQWAASLGDRSENADYQYNKRRLREIDRRVRFLRKTLDDIQVVHYHPQQEGKIFFGAWVALEDIDGEQLKFRIVGPEEIYGQEAQVEQQPAEPLQYISIDSPMARACLSKQVDDEVIVQTPAGKKAWYVIEIAYQTRSN